MVEREENAWGVKLQLQPLSDRPEMLLVAEIARPKSAKTPDTKIWLNGMLANKPMKITELLLLREQIQNFAMAIKEETAQLRAKATRKGK